MDQAGYDYGTEEIENIEERKDGHLYAYVCFSDSVCFSDFHIDFEAVKEADIQVKTLD